MEPIFWLTAIVLALWLGREQGRAETRRNSATPVVIRSMPINFKNPPQPYGASK